MKRLLVALVALPPLLGAAPADADSWKNESFGGGRGFAKGAPDLRGCRIERRWTGHGYREVIDCDRPVWGRPARQLPPVPFTPRWGPPVTHWRGLHCREYSTLARIGRRLEEVWGVACRMPDGSWELQ
ncbi:MAG: hypothetical protein HQL40_03715 [Alphaproteobacteria bacterium]|nr:hypothetical protein [Alphaproteobacteria bacterium]